MSQPASEQLQSLEKSAETKPNEADKNVGEYEDAEKNYKPKTIKFWIPLIGMYLAIFLVALVSLVNHECACPHTKEFSYHQDRTIIAVAIPKITDDFDSIKDIGWYGTAYMLTAACFFPISGRIYQVYPTKPIYIASITIFEAGSALCGAAPSSVVLIIGRAVAGIGASGIFSGGMMLILPIVPLRKRPMFTSFFGMVFALASVIGPIIGGSFTDKV
jgi:MFS family permease